jgi:rhamnogalacturonyl hydrolase YesR
MVRASALTGDEKWARIGVTELEQYAADLRDEKSRCYHQGRGWLPNDARSPGCWSRGQGWLLHGFITALPLLKKASDLEQRVLVLFRELIDAIIPYQTKSGLWNQLIDQPEYPCTDTSGSAFIYEALELGLQAGYLQGDLYRNSAEQAWSGLLTQVHSTGLVGGVSMGPGPNWVVEPWQRLPSLTGDPHGIFTVLFACAAREGR